MRIRFLILAFGILAACTQQADQTASDVTRTRGEGKTDALQVVDGDTVVWLGQVRDLAGIDAPELGQSCEAGGRLNPCGLDAAFALAKRAALEPASCEAAPGGGSDLVCHVGTTSLADLQVSDGYAVTLPGAAQSLRLSESTAKVAHLGIWRGRFVEPNAWRDGDRLEAERDNIADACPLVGLRIDGSMRYVVPTDDAYGRYKILPNARHLCSDEVARRRGWRHLGERA